MDVGGVSTTRSRDALGNVTLTPLDDGDATLRFDGFSRLREVDRADTAVITYGYRPDGLLVSRSVVCNSAPGCTSSSRTYVYSGLLLLAEYEGTNLVAEYFYSDGSDIPVAAELYDPNLSAMRRVYYATDRMGSVVGVMDDAGNLIERVSYDPYGRPTIEPADDMAPMVSSVEAQPNGDLLVAFSEEVLPPLNDTSGDTIVNSLASIGGAMSVLKDVSGTMTSVAGSWSYEDSATGYDHGTVLRFVPGTSIAAGTAVQLEVNAGGLVDSWANGTSAATLNFNMGTGVLYTGPPQGSTSTPVIERSLVNNGLMFQAHLWDADAGLYLARARVLDPTTGTFLQRDPSGYSDSVNLYAFTKSDPVNHRDVTGRVVKFLKGRPPASKEAQALAQLFRPPPLLQDLTIADVTSPLIVSKLATHALLNTIADMIAPPPQTPEQEGVQGVMDIVFGLPLGAVSALGGEAFVLEAELRASAKSASAIRAARATADVAQLAAPRPAAAAALRVEGASFADVSRKAASPERTLHPEVQEALDQLPESQRSAAHGQCAEPGCISQALEAGVDPAGGKMKAVKVRAPGNPQHGAELEPCSSCAWLLEFFDIGS